MQLPTSLHRLRQPINVPLTHYKPCVPDEGRHTFTFLAGHHLFNCANFPWHSLTMISSLKYSHRKWLYFITSFLQLSARGWKWIKNAKTIREETGELYFLYYWLFQSNLYGEVEELVTMLTLLNILMTYYDQAIWSELWKCCSSTGTQGTNGYRFYRHWYNYNIWLLCMILSLCLYLRYMKLWIWISCITINYCSILHTFRLTLSYTNICVYFVMDILWLLLYFTGTLCFECYIS